MKHPRFTLRALMLAVLVIGLVLAWRVDKAHRQRDAVATIREYGGFVFYDWENKFDTMNGMWLPTHRRSPPGPAWLRRMLGDEYFQEVAFANLVDYKGAWAGHPQADRKAAELMVRLKSLPHLKRLYISGKQVNEDSLDIIGSLADLETLAMWDAPVSDAGMRSVGGLKNLRSLVIQNAGLTDADLRHLASLTNLEELALYGNKITDAGLAHLGGLTGLKHLELNSPEITDAGLPHLKRMTRLEVLDLRSSRVSDAGLDHLAGLKSLKMLWLPGTGVTIGGTNALCRKLPKLNTIP